MSANYIEENRHALLSIFGQVRAGKSLEFVVSGKFSEEELDRFSCLNAILIHKYENGHVDFPIRERKKIRKIDKELAEDLYTIVLCEDGVREGLLIRSGLKYCPVDSIDTNQCKRFGKYLIKGN